MIKIKGILTERQYQSWPSYQLVYEWEDIISQKLDVPIRTISFNERLWYKAIKVLKLIWVLNLINRIRKPQSFYLYYVMSASNPYLISYGNNVIPIIIDFFLNKEDLKLFYEKFKSSRALLISSLEVVDFLKENNCPIPIFHFPLSLPDKYQPKLSTKKYQILLAGRQNEILQKFLNKYLAEYPEVEYVYMSDQEEFIYTSNLKGNLGKFKGRIDFFNLLLEAEISFYSTPGIDGGETRTKGFNQVTPKYLELLAANVKIIGRYSTNKETAFYELEKVCQNIENYDQFRNILTLYLTNQTKNNYDHILEKHYTSRRVTELIETLQQI